MRNCEVFYNRKRVKVMSKSQRILFVAIVIFSLLFTGCRSVKVLEESNLANAKAVVDSGGDINNPLAGYTRLYLAAQQKDTVLIKYLLANGADIDKKSRGWQPIHWAVFYNQPEIAKILIENGADLTTPDPLGETPLQRAESKGFVEIAKLLKGESIVENNKLASDFTGNMDNTALKGSNDSIPDKQKNEKSKAIVSVSFIRPIPGWIGPTKFKSVDAFNPKNYDISMWGIGGGIQKKVYKDFGILIDMARYSFKQKLVNEGESVYLTSTVDGVSYLVPFPLGAKYVAQTTSIRIGAKYTYTKLKVLQPWLGVAYGVNIWDAKYVTFDEEKAYGKAKGTKFRHALMAGIDIRMEDVGMVTLFFDAVSPVAEFTMKDLFGLGDYYQFDATTYPSPRIGISLSVF